jgi:regulatory protein
MKISSLQQQKRRRDRVSVFLDEEFWVGISERLCSELALVAGMEISEEQKREIEEAALEDGALQYAFDRLSAGIIPKAQLKEKLSAKGFSPSTVDSVIRRCEELSLLDDSLWAETVSEERADRGQGARKVEDFLRRKGIDPEKIEEAIEKTFSPEEEVPRASEVIEERYATPLSPPDQRRAYQMLLRRGFSHSAAGAVVESLAMSREAAEETWGSEEALEIIQKRFSPDTDRSKVWSYLQRRSFSPGAIRQALDDFYS